MDDAIPRNSDPVDFEQSVLDRASLEVEGLSERERRFAEAYVQVAVDLGKDAGAGPVAYRRAFPLSQANTQTVYNLARGLLKQPSVQAYILRLREELSMKALVPVSRVIEEVERLALGNFMDFGTINPDGSFTVDLTELTPAQAACIQEIVIEETFKPVGKRTKIRLYNKLEALDKLLRIHGKYNDKVAISVDDLDKVIQAMEAKMRSSLPTSSPGDNAVLIDATATEVKETEHVK
jgi:hypothetical protein